MVLVDAPMCLLSQTSMVLVGAPMCLFKVRLCSPFAAGLTLLVGALLDYPQLLRLALPNALHARISSVSLLYIFIVFLQVHILIFVPVQNLPQKNICLKNLLDYCVEA